MTFKTEDAVAELERARATLGIGYGQSVEHACAALMNRLTALGEHPTTIARAAVKGQSGMTPGAAAG